MRTYDECISCFSKQAQESARLMTNDESVRKDFMNELDRLISTFSVSAPPPEMSRLIHQATEKYFGPVDLFKEIKRKSNVMALGLYPKLKEMVRRSGHKLLTAAEIAIAGNVIDYAIKNTLNIEQEIKNFLNKTESALKSHLSDYPKFEKDLAQARTIVYLADNAGEIVFDRVFIEEFPKGKKVFFVVRGKPVINDALEEDARMCGLDSVAEIVSSGVDAPGTILRFCSKNFLKIFDAADLVISKGQGNYEALSDCSREVYFFLKVKCPVIARHSGATVGDIVLKRNR